jgi:hypothetical protein
MMTEKKMNEKRRKAFDEWWLLHATPEGRTTPSAIWEAACDWMKEEMIWRMEQCVEKNVNEQS